MKRMADLILSICFVGFMAAALTATLARPPETASYWENRRLAALPEPSAETVGDGQYFAQLETYLADHAAGRTTLLRIQTGMDLALHRPVVNDVVPTENSLLPFLPADTQEPPAQVEVWANAMADNLQRIHETVTGYGGYFCYVGVPPQADARWEEYPWYLNDRQAYIRAVVAALSEAMAQRGVPYLDVRAALGLGSSADWFASRVDNHYTMEGAYQTYRVILEKTAAESGLSFPILGKEDLTEQTLPNPYLGSRERKLLDLAQRDESLSILLPREEVPFTRTDSGAVSPPTVYDLPDSEEAVVTYGLYMGGDRAHTVIDTGREELPTLLIYGDSFTNPVECLAYLSFDEMHALDLRHYRDSSLEDYIRELQPEVVICIRDYDALLSIPDNGGGSSPDGGAQ